LGSKTTPFWASKRRRFGHFIIIFFKKKKRKEKRKRKILKKKKKNWGKEIGGGSSHPLGQKWGGRPPHFWPRGGWSHPHGRSGCSAPDFNSLIFDIFI
jgi:hypothetical protein